MIGASIGIYRITAKLGAGGMGEVYLAHDTKLDRDVAIKILPESFAHDAERVARFEREAKVLAALNHPNIAQIYGIEEHALVMELVEGPTLAERIAQGALPLDEALNIAKQIAEALEAAHEKGITHRDLKPANVKLRTDGTVKVLDFGLATAAQVPGTDGNPSISPTLTLDYAATRAGMIMGTAAYMSPEQASGKPVDKRSDIWSFGVVLWEILTGKRLFEGETISHVMADVLKGEIDFGKLPKATPAAIQNLLERCLERDAKNRLRDIGEARITINSGKEQEGATKRTPAPRHPLVPWIAASVAIAVAAFFGLGYYRAVRPAELKPLVRLDVDLGSDLPRDFLIGSDVIISPDGTRLAYVSQGRLFARRLDQTKAIELPGTEGAYAPFFSPDGQWVAFFAQRKLKKIPAEGGAVIALCDAPNARGGSWGEDGSIFATLTFPGGIVSRIPASGGIPTPVTELAHGDALHHWPQILPGGKALLFTANTTGGNYENATIEVMSLRDRRRKTLQRGGTYGRYFAASAGYGYLVYVNQDTLFAVPFDLNALEVRGTPMPVLEGVRYNNITGSAHFDFSRTGTLVYRRGGSDLTTVQWMDRQGKTQPLLAKPGLYLFPKLSPDGKRLALSVTEGSTSDIWVYEWERDTMTRLTFGGANERNQEPIWTPDGKYIAFRRGGQGLLWTRADGAGAPRPLTQSGTASSFAPDGKRLAFFESAPNGKSQLWSIPLGSDGGGIRAGKPEPFLQDSFNEAYPAFSPDGRWLAYASNESGTYQVYVRAFPNTGSKWQVSNGGGTYSVWSRNEQELLFHAPDNRIMVAAYTVKGGSFVSERPRPWSETQFPQTAFDNNYDLAPDGKRIAALMPAETPEAQQAQTHVVFLENFFDELRRRVPVSK